MPNYHRHITRKMVQEALDQANKTIGKVVSTDDYQYQLGRIHQLEELLAGERRD